MFGNCLSDLVTVITVPSHSNPPSPTPSDRVHACGWRTKQTRPPGPWDRPAPAGAPRHTLLRDREATPVKIHARVPGPQAPGPHCLTDTEAGRECLRPPNGSRGDPGERDRMPDPSRPRALGAEMIAKAELVTLTFWCQCATLQFTEKRDFTQNKQT